MHGDPCPHGLRVLWAHLPLWEMLGRQRAGEMSQSTEARGSHGPPVTRSGRRGSRTRHTPVTGPDGAIRPLCASVYPSVGDSCESTCLVAGWGGRKQLTGSGPSVAPAWDKHALNHRQQGMGLGGSSSEKPQQVEKRPS